MMDRRRIRAVLLDIEGTTTPIEFAYEVLFPYARSHVEEYLHTHISSERNQDDVRRLFREHTQDVQRGRRPPGWKDELPALQVQSVTAYVHWLMDRDRKSTPLKSLQGRIWEAGFRNGELQGQVYPDVPAALERWHAAGLRVCIFSSGSVQAQKLIFAHSSGDLSRFLHRHFDTTTGPKREPDSYRRISLDLELKPEEVLFLSDDAAELDAAAAAGMKTVQCVRPGVDGSEEDRHPRVRTFDAVLVS